jgi:hypothetical protein
LLHQAYGTLLIQQLKDALQSMERGEGPVADVQRGVGSGNGFRGEQRKPSSHPPSALTGDTDALTGNENE